MQVLKKKKINCLSLKKKKTYVSFFLFFCFCFFFVLKKYNRNTVRVCVCRDALSVHPIHSQSEISSLVFPKKRMISRFVIPDTSYICYTC